MSTRTLLGCAAIALVSACNGLNPPVPVSPIPATATGLPIFLEPDPNVVALEDNVGRPLTIAIQHDVRDVLEQAGFKLVDSEDNPAGLSAQVTIQRAGGIHADVFIHGAEACGIKLDLKHDDKVIATAEPESPCVATSTYYGMLSKDAAIAMVNLATKATGFVTFAKGWHPPVPKASAVRPEEPGK